MTGSLGTAQTADGIGLSASDHRHILEALYPNTGVIAGGTVNGTTGVSYSLSDTVVAVKRASGDGMRIGYIAAQTIPSTAGDSTYNRIDLIWAKAQDPATDGDSQMTVGVTNGTPAATPVEPAVPAGCVKILSLTVGIGVTNFSTGTTAYSSADYVIPYGASMGVIASGGRTINDLVNGDGRFRPYVNIDFTVPTDRFIQIVWEANVAFHTTNATGSYYLQFEIDNKVVNNGNDEIQVSNNFVKQQYSYWGTVLKGTHHLTINLASNVSRTTGFYMNNNGANAYVIDEGVSR